MKKFSFLLYFLLSTLFAHDFDNEYEDEIIAFPEYITSTQEVHNQQENYFLTSTEFRIPLKVNPITGEYSEDEEDLVVAGSEPLSLRRFYNSLAPHNSRYGMWRYNPESFLVANFEWEAQEIFASIGDEDGSLSSLKRAKKDNSFFYYQVPKGFQTLQSDGQSHPLNTHITYQKIPKSKDKKSYRYAGTIIDGSGRKRRFDSPYHSWIDPIFVKRWKRILGIKVKHHILFTPDTWTPYQLPITEERLPNGNIICYTYTPWQRELDHHPIPQLLESITAYNSDKSQILGFIKLQYPRGKHNSVLAIEVTGSDGRTSTIHHSTPPIHLIHTEEGRKPSTYYEYEKTALKRITRPEGRILSTEYNSDKKVMAQYAPVGNETRYCYGVHGQLERIIKPDGHAIDHQYDELGRLIHYRGKGFDYRYHYDARDRIVSVFDGKRDTKRSYDCFSNLLEEVLAHGIRIHYRYDSEGRKIHCQIANSDPILYSYEGIHLSKVAWKEYQYHYTKYDLEGQLLEGQSPLGRIDITRDPLGRILSLQTALFSARYESYDSMGNLLHYRYRDSKGECDQYFRYDDLDQLIEEKDHRYEYDSLQNRIKKDSYEYAINSLCQVTKDGENDYLYDRCGNLVWDGKRKYHYDGLDRLIAIEEGENRTEYEYDAFHRRLSKTSYVRGKETKHLRYLWEGNNEVGVIDEKDKIQELRILGEGLAAEIGAALFYELQGKVYLPLHDHRGSVVALIDLEKKESGTYRYTAFGEEEVEGILSPWRFSSKRVDEESGLLFFGRRYYHPELGRWITQDPEGFDDGPNLYAYLHNCPLTDWDPYGLYSWQGFWSGTKEFFYSAGSYVGTNFLDISYEMGEWSHAHYRSEQYQDHTALYNKTQNSREGWENIWRASKKDQLGIFIPGIMETCKNPRSPTAWGKGVVDTGLLACTVLKAGKVATLGRVAKLGENATILNSACKKVGKSAFLSENFLVDSNISKPRYITPQNFFSVRNYAETEKILMGKFGPPRGAGAFNKSFYNSKTGRTFNLHWDPLHREGKPHIDIRKRGLPSDYYKNKPFFLREE